MYCLRSRVLYDLCCIAILMIILNYLSLPLVNRNISHDIFAITYQAALNYFGCETELFTADPCLSVEKLLPSLSLLDVLIMSFSAITYDAPYAHLGSYLQNKLQPNCKIIDLANIEAAQAIKIALHLSKKLRLNINDKIGILLLN